MTTIFLHVGPPKTATTSLQAFLSSVQEQLMADGVLYPSAGRLKAGESYTMLKQGRPVLLTGPDIAHHLLPWTLRDLVQGVPSDSCWAEVLKEIRTLKPESVVLSSEGFSWLPEECIRQVGTLLREFSVRVVIYFRDELDWQLSRYKQNVKTGVYHRPFRAFIREEYLRFISYERLIQRYADVFGPGSICLRSFEKLRRELTIEKDFIEVLGKDPARYRGATLPAGRKNISPPDEAINMIRWLNWVQHHLGNPALSAGFFQRSRRSVLQSGRAYRVLRRIPGPAFRRPTARDEDARYLCDLTSSWLQEILDRYMSADDRPFHDQAPGAFSGERNHRPSPEGGAITSSNIPS